MLMDEPFGAIDPIVRERLQNEFLRLQSEVRKTIVFVTHDFDEAIKMGDRIAILQEGSRLAQYDTPERILTSPANDFVADFIGSGATLKRLNLSRVADIELGRGHVVRADSSAESALAAVRQSDDGRVLVLDELGRPRRWVEAADVRRGEGRRLDEVGREPDAVVSLDATLADALNDLVVASGSVVVVVDGHGAYRGLVDISRINRAARAMHRDRAAPDADADADADSMAT
jgi:osmoprotectant transport system ATP-binding protein